MSTATTVPGTAPVNPWNKTASSGSGGGGEYFLCPSGNHVGTITGLIHAGTVSNNFGESADTIILAFQLMKKQEDGRPFVLADKYTYSLNTKANFRKVVEAVEGRSLADGESYDPRDLVGRVVLVSVKHSQGKGDKAGQTYHNVAGVSALPEGFPAPDDSQFPIEPLVWSVMDGTPFPAERAGWLPWVYGHSVQSIVENSAEVRARQSGVTMPPPKVYTSDDPADPNGPPF